MKKRRSIIAMLLTVTFVASSFFQNGLESYATAAKEQVVAEEGTEELTLEEFKKKYPTGLIEGEDNDTETIDSMEEYYKYQEQPYTMALEEEQAELPDAVDNTQSIYFPEIGDQVGGSCTCWADVYYNCTYTINKARGLATTEDGKNIPGRVLSPEFVYNQVRIGESTSNGSHDFLVAAFMEQIGAPTRNLVIDSDNYSVNEWAYTWNPTEEVWNNAALNAIKDSKRLKITVEEDDENKDTLIKSPDDTSLEVIKAALSEGAVLGMNTDIYTWQAKEIVEGSHKGEIVYIESKRDLLKEHNESNYGGHRMTIVGYDDTIWADINGDGIKQEAEFGAFKIANSWGEKINVKLRATDGTCLFYTKTDNGCHWVSYDSLNKVSAVEGVAAANYRYPLFDGVRQYFPYEDEVAPNYFLKLVLNTDSRKEISGVTISARQNGKIIGSRDMSVVFDSNNDSDRDLHGNKTNAQDGTLTLDISNIVENLNADTISEYTWEVSMTEKRKNTLKTTVKELAIVDANGVELFSAGMDESNEVLNGTTKKWELVNSNISILSFTADKSTPMSVSEGMKLTLEAEVDGNSEDYEYRFGIYSEEASYNISENFQDESNATIDFFELYKSGIIDEVAGSYGFFVDVRDKETKEKARANIYDFVIEGIEVSKITTDLLSPQMVGAEITIEAILEREVASEENIYTFTINKDGKQETLEQKTPYSAVWTPTEGGKYLITYSVKDSLGGEASKTITYYVDDEGLATIYYKNDSWSEAYILYKLESGEWIETPGEKMYNAQANEYNWVYYIDMGEDTQGSVCFNNGNNSWDNNNGNNYVFTPGINSIGGEKLTLKIKKIVLNPNKGYSDYMAYGEGGVAPYAYSYEVVNCATGEIVEEGQKWELSSPSIYEDFFIKKAGNYKVNLRMTDAIGQVAYSEETFEIKPFVITDITTDLQSPQEVGKTIVLTAKRENAYVYKYGLVGDWTIKNKTTGTEENLVSYYSDMVSWTPKEIGEYEITVNMTDNLGEDASCTISYTILEEIENQAIVYYANSSWTDSYIHYQVGSGEWTTAPGVVMEKSTEQENYQWKYVIDLGEEESATVCFNNGSGTWDSCGGANYTVKAGAYGIKGGAVCELETVTPTPTVTVTPTAAPTITATPTVTPTITVVPTVIPTPTPAGTVVYFDNTVANWSDVYAYVWNNTSDAKVFAMEKEAVGIYKVELTGIYKNIIFKNTETTWNLQTNDLVIPTTDVNCYKPTSTENKPSGTWYWYEGGVSPTVTPTPTPKDTTTVYYKANDAWSTAYVHYSVNGVWTSVPGKEMTATTETGGYNYKFEIDLGTATEVVVCFNNGSGTWDSNNGANYKIQKGTYGIKDGAIAKLN